MGDLAPCAGCRRHVRIDEAVCPFCAAPVAATAPTLPVGRFARAAVFAGAAALAGCGGKGKPAEDPNQIENEAAVTVDAAVPDAEPLPEKVRIPDDTCCMPYGAPPMRDRVV